MGWLGKAVATAGVWLAWGITAVFAQPQGTPDFVSNEPSQDTRFVAQWVMQSADHRGLPFAVVDKKGAHLYVFDGDGRLSGATPVLLGQTIGDESAPEVGAHTQAGAVPMHERTTPAGRYISRPGLNLDGEHVVWVDYASAFAIHRLRPGASLRAREARLASASPDDNRASLGCVVVPVAFYENVVHPVLGRSRAVIYVLPETRSVRDLFGAA